MVWYGMAWYGVVYTWQEEEEEEEEEEEGEQDLFTMSELSGGGCCRQLPPFKRNEDGSQALRRVRKGWDIGRCEFFAHRACVRSHINANYSLGATYKCVVCWSEIWRQERGPRSRPDGGRWAPVLCSDL